MYAVYYKFSYIRVFVVEGVYNNPNPNQFSSIWTIPDYLHLNLTVNLAKTTLPLIGLNIYGSCICLSLYQSYKFLLLKEYNLSIVHYCQNLLYNEHEPGTGIYMT